MATILISGGKGLIGTHLCPALRQRGYDVTILSRTRNTEKRIPSYHWNIEKKEIDREAIATADYIIHLAGAGIGEKRWTRKRKQHIADSRIKSGQLIFNEVIKQNRKLKAFISASAIGYYGTLTSDRIFRETDSPGGDFLGQICKEWEDMADKFRDTGTRTVKIRTGIVLTDNKGALSKMAMPVKKGFGAAIGSGKQHIPWIHIDDLCGIYIKAIEDIHMHGAYNAVAPEHITNKEFTLKIAGILNKRICLPNIPGWVMKTLFGRMSVILEEGSRVSADKILAGGYKFTFPLLESALKNIFHQEKIQ